MLLQDNAEYSEEIFVTAEIPPSHLCPLMPSTSQCAACDIPTSRMSYLKKHAACHKGDQCLPRKKTPKTVYWERFGPKRKKPKPRLYGNGYAEAELDGQCVVCQAGKWYFCYLEYGDDPVIRDLIRGDYIRTIDYDTIAKKLMAEAVAARKKKKAP
jgi:hypothetical protein